jgi:hypothetical protein
MSPNPDLPPEPGTIQPFLYGLIFCWLVEDYWGVARIQEALDETGATAGQIAEGATLAAASLLSDALGSAAKAAEVAERRWQTDSARAARQLVGRQERIP